MPNPTAVVTVRPSDKWTLHALIGAVFRYRPGQCLICRTDGTTHSHGESKPSMDERQIEPEAARNILTAYGFKVIGEPDPKPVAEIAWLTRERENALAELDRLKAERHEAQAGLADAAIVQVASIAAERDNALAEITRLKSKKPTNVPVPGTVTLWASEYAHGIVNFHNSKASAERYSPTADRRYPITITLAPKEAH